MNKVMILISIFAFSFTSDIPELNQKVIKYVDSVMGKKVDRGECWDLAAGALAYADAYFDRTSKKAALIYGRRVNPDKEEIFPGDLIQFENVKMEWKEGNATYTETMAQHTAIVYKVNAEKDYEIAHQNTSAWGKKVQTSNFNLNRMKKGKVMIYRPVKRKP